ncbi:MAG TPA: ATP-binding protein [Dissulfurispiraceae bacterium]|nr:ATP-binding protein [Dissulfurispiraceae bacterium]
MQIKQRLRMNSILLSVGVCIIVAVIAAAGYRVARAIELSKMADAIMTASYERLMLRTDYFQTGSERSKLQLISKQKEVGNLLKSAAEKFGGPEDKAIIDELLEVHESTGKLARSIREAREKRGPNAHPDVLSEARGNMLLSQLNMRIYETILLNSRLQKSGNDAVISAFKLTGGGIFLIVVMLSAAALVNERATGRLITERISRLRDGAVRIGEGNLDDRIALEGNDEFSDLSTSFDNMTARLHESQLQLEAQIEERSRAEALLRESHERLKKVLEVETVGVMFWDLTTGCMTDANDTFLDMMGYSRREVEARQLTWQKLTPPEYVEASLAEIEKLNETGRVGPYEKEYFRSDGTRQWLLFAGSSLGENACVEFCVDISDRKKAEEGLRKAFDDLETRVAERTKELNELNATLEHRVVERTAELKAANESLRGSRVAALNLMEDSIAARQRAEELNKVLLKEINVRKQAEAEAIRLNKALKALSDSSQAIIRANDETAFLNDICRIIIDDCGYSMVWIGYAQKDDEKSVLPVAHAGFEEGYLDTLKISWADTERGRGPTGTAIRTGVMSVCPNMLTNPDFEPWRAEALRRGYAASAAFPLISNNEVFGAVSIYSGEADPFSENEVKLLSELADNVSYGCQVMRLKEAQKGAEQELMLANVTLTELNRELESFVYSASHDLRAPIRAISGFTEIVEKKYGDRFDEKGREYLARIRHGAVRMTGLIDDLLHLSRVSRQDMTRIKVDMGKKADMIIANLMEAKPDRKVDVVIGGDLTASVDPRLIEVALSNLIGNAWKFTSKTDNARIELGSINRDGQTVFYVRDNGAGFDQKFAERMFLPFHRLHTTSEFEGTGIGLAIADRVIRRHGGRIWAEGKVGKGATIYFTVEE